MHVGHWHVPSAELCPFARILPDGSQYDAPVGDWFEVPFKRAENGAVIRMKRVYEPAAPQDGVRILVERLWPRGLTREQARVEVWLRDLAPSPALRKWFSHDPRKWSAFCRQYWKELEARLELVAELRSMARRGVVTLVYAARDEEHNSARALKTFVEAGRP